MAAAAAAVVASGRQPGRQVVASGRQPGRQVWKADTHESGLSIACSFTEAALNFNIDRVSAKSFILCYVVYTRVCCVDNDMMMFGLDIA